MKRLLKLREKSGGSILFFLRFPIRAKNVLLRNISTWFWKKFLKEVGNDTIIEWGVHFEHPKNVIIKNNVYIGKGCIFGTELFDGFLILKDNVQISEKCKIDHSGTVEINENCVLSSNVTIFSHSHGNNPHNKAIGKKLIIEKNSWVGFNTVILENTETIKEGIIIGAGSIVTKTLDRKNSLYAGSPAKYIKILHRD